MSTHEVEDCGTGSLGAGHSWATLSRTASLRERNADNRGSKGSKDPRTFGSNTAGASKGSGIRKRCDQARRSPLLARYGTSYGLFDEWICDYACVVVSDAYRLGEYVGDSVWVSGPLREVIGGMPVMEVTHLEMLKMKWMR